MSDHAPILTETTGSRPPDQPADSPTEAARGGREAPHGRVDRSSLIIGVGAVCAILGMLSLATQQIWSIFAGEVIEFHTPILGRILYAAQITLFVIAVVGLYLISGRPSTRSARSRRWSPCGARCCGLAAQPRKHL